MDTVNRQIGSAIEQFSVNRITLCTALSDLFFAPVTYQMPGTGVAVQKQIKKLFMTELDAVLREITFVGLVKQLFAVHENTIVIPEYGSLHCGPNIERRARKDCCQSSSASLS
jgi:hypothetical protein